MKFILVHPRGLCGPSKFFDLLGPRGPHRMHCGREFLLPVSVGSVRSSRVELVAAGVKLRGARDPAGPGPYYYGAPGPAIYREIKRAPPSCPAAQLPSGSRADLDERVCSRPRQANQEV